jgi:hypothetical protein
MRLVGADEASAARERQAWPEVDRVAMTEVDGEGGQAVLLTRCWDEHVGTSVNLLARDDWGIMGVHGLRQAPAEDLFEVVSGALEEEGLPLVDVDLAAARGAVLSALQANAATGHPVPCEFELWEPFLHDSFPPQDDEPVLAPELDDAPYARRRDLLLRKGRHRGHVPGAHAVLDPAGRTARDGRRNPRRIDPRHAA